MTLRWLLRASASLVAYAALTAAASADPISATILATVGVTAATVGVTGLAAATAATTFALTTAASAALGYAASLLTSKSTTSASGVQSEVQMGGDVPRQIPFGTVRTAGHFVYFCGVGEKNKELYLVYVLADWECDGLDHVYIDDEKKTLTPFGASGTEDVLYFVEDYGVNFTIAFFRGALDQEADSVLVAAAASRTTGLGDWSANHKGAGLCYVRIKLTFDEDLFQGGIPQIDFQLRGAKLYDRRLDSTAGGSGSYLWADPTTWEYSENPVVMEENYRRGFYRNGVRILGMGISGSDLLSDHYVSAANVCDETVTEGGDDVARYRCSAIVADDAEYRTATDTFMSACGGVVVEKSGLFGPLAGASQTEVATLTDDDLIGGFDTNFALKVPRSELFNSVMGSYTKAEENWQSDSFAPVINSTWEAEDNSERLIKDVQLLQVTSGYQASRLAKIIAAQGRKQARHTGVYGPAFSAVEAGDWVELENRFGTFTMQITSKREVGPLRWQFAMRETGADVFGGAATAPTNPPIVQEPLPPHATTLTGFVVTAVSIQGNGGQIRPGIQVDWTPPSDPSVVAVIIEYRVVGQTTVTPITVLTPLDGTFIIQSDLMAGTVYEVRARFKLNPDLTSAWTSFVQVTTTSAYIVQTSKIASDTQKYFDALQAEFEGSGLSLLLESLRRYQNDTGLQYSYNTSLQQVLATQNDSFAQVTFRMDALASDTEAIAQALLQVEAESGNSLANGAFKMEAVAAEGGASASIAAFVSADNGENYVRAGYRLDVDTGGVGRFVVMADQFAIVQNAGGVPFTPFAVLGPDTYINRVIVNDEILSDNYATDGSGNPAAGFRMGDDGKVRAEDARFTDFAARGGTITERPLVLAVPNFRNGVPDNLCVARWNSAGNIIWSPSLSWLTMGASFFHRTPETVFALFSQVRGDSTSIISNQIYFVPVGKRLPPKIVGDLAGTNDNVEWRDDGTIVRISYNGNGGISTQNTARGWWMYDVERDPLNLARLNKMIAGLGFTLYAQPLRVPELLNDGVTPVTVVSFKVWGAGGAKDQGGGQGGPGGYVAGTFAVGTKASSALIKHGDMLWLIPGQGGLSKASEVIFGFGGRGQSQERRASGGGLSGVFLHSITRANALLIGGGGGGAEGGRSGGPGGAALSGNNGVSGTDDEIMTGLSWLFDGTNSRAAGGGGYIGGGYLSASGGSAGGRGGSNFIRAGATSTTNSASAVDGSGGASTPSPPNTGDADYIAWRYCLGNAADVGEGKTSTTTAERGGNGLIVVTFS